MNILELQPNLGPARGTSEYSLQCWPNAQYIDWGGELNHIASAVFDRETGLVYCVELFTGDQALRYIEPEFAEEWFEECQQLAIDTDDSGQGLWIDIDANTVLLLIHQLKELNDPTR